MQNQILLQSAFILHTRPYLNSSLIASILTKEYGLLKLVIKGARRAKSRIRSQIQLFMPISINFLNKRSLGVLLDAEQQEYFECLPPDKLTFGLYLNELVIKLLHEHDPHPRLFDIYKEALIKLRKCENIETVLRKFEILMLQEIGYGIDFFKDARHGGQILPNQKYFFNADYGFEEISQNKNYERTFTGFNILEMGNMYLDDQNILKDAKYILREAIAKRLGKKEINSRKLIIV